MSDVLVIDTSTNSISVACGSSSSNAIQKSIQQPSSHAENILNCVDDVLKQRDIQIGNVSAIGVGIGPGLFTGLRVGVSCAHAFSHALGITLVYFSSLELSALSSINFSNQNDEEIVVAKDARRNELYFARYSFNQTQISEVEIEGTRFATSLKRLENERLISPEELVNKINQSRGTTVCLDSLDTYPQLREIADENQNNIVEAKIDTRFGIDLIVDSVMSGFSVNALAPSVMYLRKSDAQLSWDRNVK